MKFRKDVKEIKKRISKVKDRIIIIGMAGPTSSGKTTLAKELRYNTIDMDDYYLPKSKRKTGNFDNPENLDFKLLVKDLKRLKEGKRFVKPIYSFKIHDRKGKEIFKPTKVNIIEGLWALNKKLLRFYNFKIYVDASRKTRFERRMKRDVEERGRDKKNVIKFFRNAEKMAKKYIFPTKEYADLVVKN